MIFFNKISCWPDFRTFFSHEIHEEKSITNSIRHIQNPFQSAFFASFEAALIINCVIKTESFIKDIFCLLNEKLIEF